MSVGTFKFDIDLMFYLMSWCCRSMPLCYKSPFLISLGRFISVAVGTSGVSCSMMFLISFFLLIVKYFPDSCDFFFHGFEENI